MHTITSTAGFRELANRVSLPAKEMIQRREKLWILPFELFPNEARLLIVLYRNEMVWTRDIINPDRPANQDKARCGQTRSNK